MEWLGELLGELTKEKDGLAGLEAGLTKFFNAVKKYKDFQFSVLLKEKNRLITKSKCPIYQIAEVWCQKYCVQFIKGFAKVYGVDVTRLAKQPENDSCLFEFKVKEG